jgi:hypothetical protein
MLVIFLWIFFTFFFSVRLSKLGLLSGVNNGVISHYFHLLSPVMHFQALFSDNDAQTQTFLPDRSTYGLA